MPYCSLQLGLNAALFPFTGLCNGAGFEKPPPCRRQIQSCWYRLITEEQKQPPGKLASFCQTAEAGGLCASHCPPPLNRLPPVVAHPNMCHFPTRSQLSWAGAVAWIVSESFVLSSTSVLSYLSSLLQVIHQ